MYYAHHLGMWAGYIAQLKLLVPSDTILRLRYKSAKAHLSTVRIL